MEQERMIKVGLLGLGTVGTGVIRIVNNHRDDLTKQTGMNIHVEKALVRNPEKPRDVPIADEALTTDPYEICHNPDIDVVIEVMGGIQPARDYILEALAYGKHVITANKDLLALHGSEILAKGREKGCDVFYEASVAGGIPILRTIVEGFSSDRITRMIGIVNGTTNYILSRMSQDGAAYDEVLKEAQELGFAEADPTADVEGYDAARKMAILGTLGFHTGMSLEDVDCKGISDVSQEDIRYGKALGYEMKLLGIAKRNDDLIEVSVQPTLIPDSHPLANVSGEFNAVYVYGEAVGETMFYGPGAGELPTATAVVSDLVTVAKNTELGVNGRNVAVPYKEKQLKREDVIFSKYFLRLFVHDRRGVLAKITQLLAENDISLEQVMQQPMADETAEIVLTTHTASKKDMKHVLEAFETLEEVREVKSFYRVEGGEH